MKELLKCLNDILQNLIPIFGMDAASAHEFLINNIATGESRIETTLWNAANTLFHTQNKFDFFTLHITNPDRFLDISKHLTSMNMQVIATLESDTGSKRYYSISTTKLHTICAKRVCINPTTYRIIRNKKFKCTAITTILPVRKSLGDTLIDPTARDGTVHLHTGRGPVSVDRILRAYSLDHAVPVILSVPTPVKTPHLPTRRSSMSSNSLQTRLDTLHLFTPHRRSLDPRRMSLSPMVTRSASKPTPSSESRPTRRHKPG